MRLVDRLLGELVPKPMLVDRNQAEASGCEGITEHGIDARADPRRTTRDFAKNEVAGLGILQVADEQFAPFALVDGREPESLAVSAHHAEHQLRRTRQLLERMGDEALAPLLRPREHAVADPEGAALAALQHPQPRRRPFGVPLLRNRPDRTAIV